MTRDNKVGRLQDGLFNGREIGRDSSRREKVLVSQDGEEIIYYTGMCVHSGCKKGGRTLIISKLRMAVAGDNGAKERKERKAGITRPIISHGDVTGCWG